MNFLRYTGIFLVYLFAQVFLFNKFTLLDIATPHFFLLFLLMLPYNFSPAVLMLVAFATGFSVDLLSQNLFAGVHSFSCVLMVYVRNPWVSVITNRVTFRGSEDFEIDAQPLAWTATYLLFLIFVHNFVYYIMEDLSFAWFHYKLLKIAASTAYTFFLCFLFSTLFYRSIRR